MSTKYKQFCTNKICKLLKINSLLCHIMTIAISICNTTHWEPQHKQLFFVIDKNSDLMWYENLFKSLIATKWRPLLHSGRRPFHG